MLEQLHKVVHVLDRFYFVFLLLLTILASRWRSSYDKKHAFIYKIFLLGIVGEILLRFCAWYFRNNLIVYNLITIPEFTLFFLFYYHTFDGKIKKYLIPVFSAAFYLIYIYEAISSELFSIYNYSSLYMNSYLIILALVALWKLVKETETTFIDDNGVFWINCAVLIYYSGTLFIYGMDEYATFLHLYSTVTVLLHVFINLFFYGLLFIGLWKSVKKT